MRHLSIIFCFIISFAAKTQTLPMEEFAKYPQTSIANRFVTMNLLLPDPEKGSYRATRFDWSGIISSLKYGDHQYFGYWKSTHDPLVHEDLSGPVESYIAPGLGFDEAKAGGKFIRIGVGIIERPDDKPYETYKTYKILDHGKWDIYEGDDWIEFKHIIKSDIGYGYVYTKRINLKSNEPGFTITHILENTGEKVIETDQFNHNFFMIDGESSGPAIHVYFPYEISTENDLRDVMKINGKELYFLKDLAQGSSIWMEFEGFSDRVKDHQVRVVNKNSGAGVHLKVDKPLYRMVFWACHTTYCPENFVYITVEPGKSETWVSDYTLFTE